MPRTATAADYGEMTGTGKVPVFLIFGKCAKKVQKNLAD